ncbi:MULTISPECIES: holo-ACP synthase [unclassified Hyphomonas]|jgi:holo-[acyl-carrier protein] synthase|uniref:Holo-[acyl-carrier protein] synthase n=1 Tax=hydrothermal vent metagenome TaxID=652676 RepID=A0A160TYH0_9ZZZZ|nr:MULTISPECIES: holo-ACP synthase [unclassified Hyphomonas]MAN89619.1 holo-ACP synthase [Hyphomonadaceae bacterium]MAA81896.1 holo-ACP synthase [Hyphomonas sp.]MAL43487.1 holo-ACP synthase [Hyphomonas sp.]MAX82783.1 holo-ACP synthase [Hyphomonas sp.]MBO6582747.1 holo-ACP synthase [Hyphomonas sp.]|tara:strand:+ start:16655 stop:17065 length:411 start_codon:yes stop_codon:yes gene_type:complete
MIIGIGNDLCNIERVEKTLARFGERFEKRVFTDVEIALARRRRLTAETYAKRFAAKEACAKALGTGVPRRGVHWKHLGVVNLPTGKPTLALTGGAAERLATMMPAGHEAIIHLTITDDYPWAEAQVIIEALPVTPA